MQKQKLVDVYRPGAPTTTGKPRDRQIFRVHPNEANILVSNGFADWTGRKHTGILTTIAINALLMFVGQMRMKERSNVTGMDSKTHSSQGAANPWKGVKHVRNEHYQEHFSTRLSLSITERL